MQFEFKFYITIVLYCLIYFNIPLAAEQG